MLSTQATGIRFDLTYHSEWLDGYGAQGWKLDVAMDDPEVIACTAYTGNKTPTSVLVHDMLDHLASGFGLSGYANEARAAAIHGLRNGVEVRSSYEWMTDEILGAKLLKENIIDFFPASIAHTVPTPTTPEETVALLTENNDPAELRRQLVEGFFRVGLSGIPIALSNWQARNLDFNRMHSIGLCLQALLAEAQDIILDWNADTAKGQLLVANEVCELLVGVDDPCRETRIVIRVSQKLTAIHVFA